MPAALRFTSLQAPNADAHQRQIAGYLAGRLGRPLDFVTGPWRERQAALERGEVHLAWVCGWPYTRWAEQPVAPIELLGAPVMAGKRYLGRPVYFSDVVVRAESAYRRFRDLAGARWAYNEPGSHSGYNITCYQLARSRLDAGFFDTVVAAGSHERALQLLLAGEIDASALDSTVLATELRADPFLAGRIRVIERWGPSPAPPYVAARGLSPDLRRGLRDAIAGMHRHREGRAILAAGAMRRIALLRDRDYDLIRTMTEFRQGVELHPTNL
jgi:phosphonate transport system substrate-binding protein